MGLTRDLVGSSTSGIWLGVTAVFAVATYAIVRGAGLPFISGNGGGDVFGGT